MFEFQDDFLDRLHNHLGLFALQRFNEVEVVNGDLSVALNKLLLRLVCALLGFRFLVVIPQLLSGQLHHSWSRLRLVWFRGLIFTQVNISNSARLSFIICGFVRS